MRSLLLWVRFVCVVGLLLVGATALCADGLGEKLTSIEQQYRDGADMRQVEAACLGLVRSGMSGEDLGRIYAQIPILYQTACGENVKSRREVMSPAEVIKYAEKAVSYKLDVPTAVKVYIAWGAASRSSMPLPEADGYAAARRSAVVPYLKGLKSLVESGVPAQRPAPPPAPCVTVQPGGALRSVGTEAVREQNQLAMLVAQRDMLSREIVALYTRGPEATEELRSLAFDVIKNVSLVDTLVADINKRTAQR